MAASVSCLSTEEQATLKTALAFVVLRNCKRLKTTHESQLSFCRNLLPIEATFAWSCDTDHITSMLKIALSAAAPLHHTEDVIYVTVTVNAAGNASEENGRLASVASHMARHLERSDETWLLSWIAECTLEQDIKSICSLWHCMALSSTSMTVRLLKGIGQLVDKIYNDQVVVTSDADADADVMVVNLLLLLEALVSMRLETISPSQVTKELLAAVDQKLTLPIRVEEMPAYLQSSRTSGNLSAPSKILLHLALYDLTVKLTL